MFTAGELACALTRAVIGGFVFGFVLAFAYNYFRRRKRGR